MSSADMRTQTPAVTQTPPLPVSSVVAVYPDHTLAEQAMRLLHREGYSMSDLLIVGRDFQVREEPVGFVNTDDYAAAGAGAWVGGLFGLLVGAAFLAWISMEGKPETLR